MIDPINNYKHYLRRLDAYELHQRISKFRNLSFKDMSYEDISREISNVLSVKDINGIIYFSLFPQSGKYKQKTRFYRVREINDTIKYPDQFLKEDSIWSVPASIATIQRLNRKNESLLYTSPILPSIAIAEKKVEDNKIFVLIVYESSHEINVSMIGCHNKINELTDEENFKHSMINDFFRHEFTRDVGKGTEYLYRISETIAKNWYDLPPDIQDAWCYPSVIDKNQYNVCFRPDKGKRLLSLIGIQLAKKVSNNESVIINCSEVGEYKKGNLVRHTIGSKFQKTAFPEIISI